MYACARCARPFANKRRKKYEEGENPATCAVRPAREGEQRRTAVGENKIQAGGDIYSSVSLQEKPPNEAESALGLRSGKSRVDSHTHLAPHHNVALRSSLLQGTTSEETLTRVMVQRKKQKKRTTKAKKNGQKNIRKQNKMQYQTRPSSSHTQSMNLAIVVPAISQISSTRWPQPMHPYVHTHTHTHTRAPHFLVLNALQATSPELPARQQYKNISLCRGFQKTTPKKHTTTTTTTSNRQNKQKKQKKNNKAQHQLLLLSRAQHRLPKKTPPNPAPPRPHPHFISLTPTPTHHILLPIPPPQMTPSPRLGHNQKK